VERARVPVERAVLPAREAVERARDETRRRVGSAAPDSSCAPASSEASSSESPFPISFFATPTAAGIATPIAAPAATFFGVDIPSSCSSIELLSSSSAIQASVSCETSSNPFPVTHV
jgi:hypothetical protein